MLPRCTDRTAFQCALAGQQGGPLWIERGVFDNWTNQIVIPAHSAKTFTFEVWYDAPIGSPSDVPDDLALDFSVNATPVI